MSPVALTPLTRYAVAVLAAALAIGVRLLLDPVLGEAQFTFLTVVLTVLVVARVYGFGPAAVVAVLGGLLAVRFVAPPRDGFALATPDQWRAFVLYLCVALGIAALAGSLRGVRDRAELAARDAARTRDELRVTLKSIGDAVIVTDPDGRVVEFNPAAEELTGWPAVEAVGRKQDEVFVVLDEQTRRPVESPVDLVLRQGSVVRPGGDTLLVSRDRTERPVEASAGPIRGADGRLVGAVLVFRDVTRRRVAEEDRRRLAAIVASSDDAIISKDLDGTITSWNAGAERLYGYPGAEVVGKPFALLVPPDRAGEVADAARRLHAGERLDHFETVRRRKDGTLIPVTVSYSPVRDEDGRLIGTAVITRDVSALRAAEAAARDRERQLQLVTDTAPVLIAHCDPDGRYRFVNRPFAARFGKAPEDLVGKTIAEVIGPAGYAVIAPQAAAALRGERVEFEAEVPYPDGAVRHMLCAYEPERDPAGRVTGFVAALTDVTERKRTELALRDEARTTEALYRVGRAIAAELDLAKIVQTVTDEGTALTGARFGAFFYNRVGADGESYMLFALSGVPRTLFEQFPMPRNTALFEPTFRGVGPVRLTDVTTDERYGKSAPYFGMPLGHEAVKSYLAVSVVSRSGGVLGGLFFGHPDPGRFTDRHERLVQGIAAQAAVAIDNARLYEAAERERARAEVGERHARFLADASATLAGLVDLDSTIQKVARLAVPTFADWCTVDLLGDDGGLRRVAVAHPDPAMVARAQEIHRRFPPDPAKNSRVWRVLRSGVSELVPDLTDDVLARGEPEPEYRAAIKALGVRSYLGVPLAVRGKVFGVVTFARAESGLRYDAADLAVAEDLAHRASVAVDNARLYHAVREADRRKDEFLAVLAHELRNPLAPIRNAVQILKLTGGADPAGVKARDMAERQVHALSRLVDDLLDVSRVMRGKIELRRERADLAAVVGRAVETARPIVDVARHELTVALPEQPVWVDADVVRLAQVVSNLLHNAAKYTDPGGRIRLSAGREGDLAVIRVADTGIGLTPDQLRSVFDMFTQVDATGARAQGGLGIGLTVVRNLVQLHGGTVEAHSAGLGRGSEFVVRLPVAAEPGTGPPDASPGRMVAARNVLVVDDNADAADSLAELLRLQGHDVRVAHDGPAGLALAAERPPDVAFLDIGMPRMTGHEVARRFRADPALRHVTLVAMTGWGQEEDRRRTKEAGFDHHLVKPVEPEVLLGFFAKYLG